MFFVRFRGPILIVLTALLTTRGSSLHSLVEIPSIKYRPEVTTIPFSVESADKLGLWLTFPKWNTRAAHATNQLTEIGCLSSLRLDGSYRYHATASPSFVDRLKLNIYVTIGFFSTVNGRLTAFRVGHAASSALVGLSDTSWCYRQTILGPSQISLSRLKQFRGEISRNLSETQWKPNTAKARYVFFWFMCILASLNPAAE